MKHYFLVAKDVGDLTRIFCASLEAKQVKEAPGLRSCCSSRCRATPRKLQRQKTRFPHRQRSAEHRRCSTSSSDDPVNLIRLFAHAPDEAP